MTRASRLARVAAIGVVLAAVVTPCRASGACPEGARLRGALADLDLAAAARTARYGVEVPQELYADALAEPGKAQARRDGNRALGVLVVDLPLRPLWKALNDEDHHDLDDGSYIPVRGSEVVAGTPGGVERVVFQYLDRWGIGRWWLTRIRMSADLYRESNGRLWEITWLGELDAVDHDAAPIAPVAARLRAIDASRGSWLLAELAPSCTVVEYFNDSEPGGVVGVAQKMFARKAVSDTLDGLVRLAREHLPEHADLRVPRPDGSSLDGVGPAKRDGSANGDEGLAVEPRDDVGRVDLEAEGDVGAPSDVSHATREVSADATFDRREVGVPPEETVAEELGAEFVLDRPHAPTGQPDRNEADRLLAGEVLAESAGVPERAEEDGVGAGGGGEDPSGAVRRGQDDRTARDVEPAGAEGVGVVVEAAQFLPHPLADEDGIRLASAPSPAGSGVRDGDHPARAVREHRGRQRCAGEHIDQDDLAGGGTGATDEALNPDVHAAGRV